MVPSFQIGFQYWTFVNCLEISISHLHVRELTLGRTCTYQLYSILFSLWSWIHHDCIVSKFLSPLSLLWLHFILIIFYFCHFKYEASALFCPNESSCSSVSSAWSTHRCQKFPWLSLLEICRSCGELWNACTLSGCKIRSLSLVLYQECGMSYYSELVCCRKFENYNKINTIYFLCLNLHNISCSNASSPAS